MSVGGGTILGMAAAVLDLLADVAGGIDAARSGVADLRGHELIAVVRAAEEVFRRAHALALAAAAAVVTSGTATEQGFVTPALLLGSVLRLSTHEARTRVGHAGLVGPGRTLTGEPLGPELPVAADAVAEGAIGPAHLTIVVDTLGQLPPSVGSVERAAAEEALVDAARRFDPTRLRAVADRVLTHLHPDRDRPDDDLPAAPSAGSLHVRRRRDGRYGLDGWLETVPGATLAALLDALAPPRPSPDGTADPRRADQRTADALVEACDLARSAQECPTPGGAEPPHITVTLPLDALRGVARADDALRAGAGADAQALIPAQRTDAARWGTRRRGRPGEPCPVCSDPLHADGACGRTGAVLDHAPTSTPPKPDSPRATRGSSPSSSAPTAPRWTSAAPPGPCPRPCAGRSSPGTAAARSRAAIGRPPAATPTTCSTGPTTVRTL